MLEAEALRRGAERAQRRLRQRAVVQPADAARALRRRARRSRSPAPLSARSRRSAPSAREQGVDAWYPPGRLPAGLDRAGAGTTPWAPALERLRRARRARRLSAARRRRGAPPLRLADLPRRRLLPGRRDRPAGAARRAGSRRACASAGVEVYETRRSAPVHRAAATSVVAETRARQRARGGGGARHRRRARRLPRHAPPADAHLEPHRDHRAGARRCSSEIGWTGGECITDSRAMIHYFRTTPDGRIAFGWGGGRVVFGARTHGRAERDPGVVARARAPPAAASSPALAGHADRARLGRPDRRLAQPPAGDRRARARHPLRLRLHRPRRRPVAHARPLARLAGARPPTTRRAELALVNPTAAARAARAVALPGRLGHPPRDPAQGGGDGARRASRARSRRASPGSRSASGSTSGGSSAPPVSSDWAFL